MITTSDRDGVFAVLRGQAAEAARITDDAYRMAVQDALRNVTIGVGRVFGLSRDAAYDRAGLAR